MSATNPPTYKRGIGMLWVRRMLASKGAQHVRPRSDVDTRACMKHFDSVAGRGGIIERLRAIGIAGGSGGAAGR